jgi:hypothetical protein
METQRCLRLLELHCGLPKSRVQVDTKLKLKSFFLSFTELQSYIPFCFQITKQGFDTADGLKNRYSTDFLTQNLGFILTRRNYL